MKKKLFVIVLAAIVVLAMVAPAFAAETVNITIKTVEGHTYHIYQLLKGDVSALNAGSGTLSNVAAGTNLNCSVEDFLAAIEGLSGAELGNEAAACIDGDGIAVVGNGTAIATAVAPGYYVVVDSFTAAAVEGDALSRYMIAVVGDTTLTPKADAPSGDKVILEGENEVKVNEAAYDEEIKFKLTAKIPDMTGYNYYYFVMKDEYDARLAFDGIESVTIDGTTYTAEQLDSVITLEKAAVDKFTDSFTIYFKNFLQYQAHAGEEVTVVYTAHLSVPQPTFDIESGRPNKYHVTYSNDPSYNYNGNKNPETPEKPNDDTPTGDTPTVTTETYTTALTVLKKDEKGNVLTGAAFKLEGENLHFVGMNGTVFFEDNKDGTYWRLKDGSFTDVDPNGEGVDQSQYASLTTKWRLHEGSFEGGPDSRAEIAEGMVDSNGKLYFEGLGVGSYTLTETVTPSGYNTIAPITFTISFDPETKTFSTDNENITLNDNFELELTVVNAKGTTLPSTGGIGTTIFYIIGGILVVAAGVVLITKKRMSAKN